MKPLHVLTVVGARPQFIKASAVSRAIAARGRDVVTETLVHTGQHHDQKMSDVFFDELGIAAPAYNLGVAGGTHGAMTGRMLEGIEQVLLKEKPDWVLIYGDTNSTLAAALAAVKLHIKVAHVEAGLRSFNIRMPEEINRILSDRVSAKLFCPTDTAVDNLASEGIKEGVHLVGDVMYDVALHVAELATSRSDILTRLALQSGQYVLATCHRAENTDDERNLREIVEGLAHIARTKAVVLPLHPRTVGKIRDFGFEPRLRDIRIIEPVSYFDMVALERNAEVIVTDSGGVQKEAFFYGVPCVTVRDQTEWVETVVAGWNILVGADAGKLISAVEGHNSMSRQKVSPYGSGDASDRIVAVLAASQ